MSMQVLDRWTSQDGSWEPNPAKKYSIDKVHAEKYPAASIPGAGGDHHIFVKAPVGTGIQFATGDGQNTKQLIVDSSGWVNFPLFGSSGYYPVRGEMGPWKVAAYMQIVADGIGLPDHEHVSTFLVVGDGDSGAIDTGPVPPPHMSAKDALSKAKALIDYALGVL